MVRPQPVYEQLGRVLLIGFGDVAGRLLGELRTALPAVEVVVAFRPRPWRAPPARFVELDATDAASVDAAVCAARPDLVVNAACLLSPWDLQDRTDVVARAIAAAGFAIQLPAQLPIVREVMRGARGAGFDGPVVNCSYPDVVHPVLAATGEPPTIGVGNAQMIETRVREALATEPDREPVRVVAHHAHVAGCMQSRPDADRPGPRVWLGPHARPADAAAYAGVPVPQDRSWNTLTARGAARTVGALLGAGRLRTSAPAPFGLPGGYPVEVAAGGVTLDLPPGVDLEHAKAWNEEAAVADGIASIAADGTVVFSESTAAAVATLAPGLAEPLAPRHVDARWQLLRELISR